MWTGSNAFGKPLPGWQGILQSAPKLEFFRSAFNALLFELWGLDEKAAGFLSGKILDLGRSGLSPDQFESAARESLRSQVVGVRTGIFVARRAQSVFDKIQPHLEKGPTMDFGCGPGVLGLLLRRIHPEVTLADVYRSSAIDKAGLPFLLLPPRGKLPLPSDRFANVVCCLVLHHCEQLGETLAEIVRVTAPGGRVVLVESVYGLPPSFRSPARTPLFDQFLSLSVQEQFEATLFLDYVANRCLDFSNEGGQKTPCPGNYHTREGWEAVLSDLGLDVDHSAILGIEAVEVPLVHALIVGKKRS